MEVTPLTTFRQQKMHIQREIKKNRQAEYSSAEWKGRKLNVTPAYGQRQLSQLWTQECFKHC